MATYEEVFKDMRITVVTTFHQPGLEQYGQRFIDSFSEKVDPKIKLVVYAEKCIPVVPQGDNRITIYDADDPNMSMWMKWYYVTNDPFFDYSTPGATHLGNYEPVSVCALNGIICVGTRRSSGSLSNLNAGVREFHLIEDACYATNNDKRVKLPTHISDRNVPTTAYDEVSPGNALHDSNVNDVAMTVLPDAEIDKHSGLPIPTIVAALDAGVSVITSGENGKIYDNNLDLIYKLDTEGLLSFSRCPVTSLGQRASDTASLISSHRNP